MGMVLMWTAVLVGIPTMAIAWRRSPAAGFWVGVSAIVLHTIGHLMDCW